MMTMTISMIMMIRTMMIIVVQIENQEEKAIRLTVVMRHVNKRNQRNQKSTKAVVVLQNIQKIQLSAAKNKKLKK
jgi:hypothetical protein